MGASLRCEALCTANDGLRDYFLCGAICSATLSFGVLTALSPVLPPVAAQGAAAATLLMWYKVNGAIFPPAAVLSGALMTASASAASPTLISSASFLLFPWFAGHVWLYGCAHVLSSVRLQARIAMTKHRFASLEGQTEEELRSIFN